MTEKMNTSVEKICQRNGNDPSRMIDIVREVQERMGSVNKDVIDQIAALTGSPRVEVQSVVSFYAFLSEEPKGRVVVRLCNDIIDRLKGFERVAQVFEQELGISRGETTSDGKISLEETACIGMCDQAPAGLINDVVVTRLSTDRAREIVAELRENRDPKRLVRRMGDGNNAHDLVASMVSNNIRRSGPVVLAPQNSLNGLEKALALRPAEVIRNIKTARLRGRGGAGFPTGMKWEFTRAAQSDRRFIVCNADEGEPGTFKDRVILTEHPDLVFEGMTIGGYAIGAEEGIVYLRAEYTYLRRFLESVLEQRRDQGLLGRDVGGKKGFHFDIRIQMGAGAYICGEETALLSSCEGRRGDPRNRPPFPARKGYLGCPTSVNNVETLCCVVRIFQFGAGWFSQIGTENSAGSKLLSISGDCTRPGVYEVPFGITLSEVTKMAGGDNPQAVQVGGPSGQLVGPADFDRTICFDDLSTGGSIMIFRQDRDLLRIVHAFMDFFVEESCGYCTPCRVGNTLLKQGVERIMTGRAEPTDLARLKSLAQTVKRTSRCGLGQTSPHPILSSLEKFPALYESRVKTAPHGFNRNFNLAESVGEAAKIAQREPSHFQDRERSTS